MLIGLKNIINVNTHYSFNIFNLTRHRNADGNKHHAMTSEAREKVIYLFFCYVSKKDTRIFLKEFALAILVHSLIPLIFLLRLH